MTVAVIVGRIGRAHGLHGEVAVDVRTDDPDRRFAPGVALRTEPEPAGPLTVDTARWHSGRLLVTFAGVSGRSAAEALRGTVLLVDIAADEHPDDPDEFYDHQLVGLRVETVDGHHVGTVREVLHLPGQDVLAVDRGETGQALIPFVADLVPEVSLATGRLLVAPPEGLLDVDASS